VKHESMEQTARYWVGQDKQERYMWKGTLKRFSLTQERGHDGRIREVLQEDAVSAIKKATPQKNVRFFSDFSWWFKMLPLLFELLNHLHERPFQLGKCFFLYIFMGFCVYVSLPPLRGQHTVLCHPRWLPTSGLTEFAVCWGGAGFEPRTTDLQSGALPLSHLSSSWENV
jgi:hypothetical protein